MPKYRVEESVVVNADPAKVQAIVRDFKQWPQWSPWLDSEPDCPLTYAEDGKSYRWDGSVIGSGENALVSEAPGKLAYDLRFFKPFKSQADVEFSFAADGSSGTGSSRTRVTWSMDSGLPFFMFFMVKQMKAWIATDYRRGLSKLKDYAETGSVPSRTEFVGVGEGFNSKYVGIRSSCSMDKISDDMTSSYGRLKGWLDESGTQVTAPPFAIYHKFDMVNDSVDYTAAMPVDSAPSELPDGVKEGALSVPKTYQVRHTGAYRHLGSGWSAGMMHARAKTFKSDKGIDPFEIYMNDPSTTPEAELVTQIHFPAR